MPLERLREELLGVNGIGRETADSILLYALERPSFVVDAYAARLARRPPPRRSASRLPGRRRTDHLYTVGSGESVGLATTCLKTSGIGRFRLMPLGGMGD